VRTDVAALIPAYRAATTIADVVGGVRQHVARVLVVDDGSPDATAARAEAAGATVIRHPENGGKGAALLTGLRALAADGVRRAMTLDADGQHLPDQIPVLLAASDAAPDAIVVGVRRKEGQEIRAVNLFGNWVADTFLEAIAGRKLPDTQSGFRIYPLPETLELGAVGVRYDFETEILLRAARAGLDVVGTPTRVYYPPVAERVSHFDPWVDTFRIIGTVLRVLADPLWRSIGFG
jgi:glycosyltransferase involved in cell wall biosynthesis